MTDLAAGIGQAGVRSEQALSWMLKIIHQRLSSMAPFEYSPKRGFVGLAGSNNAGRAGWFAGQTCMALIQRGLVFSSPFYYGRYPFI